jgi:hypothetical protein
MSYKKMRYANSKRPIKIGDKIKITPKLAPNSPHYGFVCDFRPDGFTKETTGFVIAPVIQPLTKTGKPHQGLLYYARMGDTIELVSYTVVLIP